MSANEIQEGGTHYKDMKLQPWDAIGTWLSPNQFRGYLLGTAIAYLARVNVKGVDGKGGLADIKKAKHTLEKLIELEEQA